MSRAKVLRGTRKGDVGEVLETNHSTRKVLVKFPDGTEESVPFSWVLVIVEPNPMPSRLFE